MNKNEIMAFETESGKIKLTIDIVRNQLATGSNINDSEIVNFMMLCKYRKLNPFLNQAYIIKFGNKAQLVTSKDVFTNRLNASELCQGWETGLILLKDEKIIERIGSFYLDGEKIVGAYCTIERKGWNKPFKWTIKMSDYLRKKKDGEIMNQWKEMPGIMLTKCVTVAAIRNIFPEEFGGMYTADELGIDENDKIEKAKDITPPEPEPEPELITPKQLKLLCASAKSTDKAIAESYNHEDLLNYIMDKLYNSGFLKSESKKEIPKHLFDKVLAEVKKTVIKKENSWNKKNGIQTTPENEEFEDFKKLDLDDGGLPLPGDTTAKPANIKTEDKKEQIKEGSKNGKSK